jgi:hypothetical protein
MFKPNIVTSGLLMSSSEKKKKKKGDKNSSSNSTTPKLVLSDDSTLTPGTNAKPNYNDPDQIEARAFARASKREQDAIALAERKRSYSNMSDREKKKRNRKTNNQAKKIFNRIRKHQGEATESATKRQNLNTGGVQDKVDAAAKSCVKPQGCGTVSPAGKKTGKKFDKRISKSKNKAYKKNNP